MERLVAETFLCIFFFAFAGNADYSTGGRDLHTQSQTKGLCAPLIQPSGSPFSEHTVQTKDCYILGLQWLSSRTRDIKIQSGRRCIVSESHRTTIGLHPWRSWVRNVRGTHWSHGHISLSEKDK